MVIYYITLAIFILTFFISIFTTNSLEDSIITSGILSLLVLMLFNFIENRIERKKEENFIRFALDLAELLKSGLPLREAVKQIEKTDYGPLNNAIRSFVAKIDWGISLKESLESLSREVNSKNISKVIKMIIEVYKSGGELARGMEAAINTILEIQRLKKMRESAIHENIIHAYLVFAFFLGIIATFRLFLLPFLSEGFSTNLDIKLIENILFHLSIIQSIFAGLALGKMYEDSYKAGAKHILIFLAMTLLLFKLVFPLLPTKGLLLIGMPQI